jgi:hypothetical protein
MEPREMSDHVTDDITEEIISEKTEKKEEPKGEPVKEEKQEDEKAEETPPEAAKPDVSATSEEKVVEKQPEKKDGVQKKIDKLTRQWREEERARIALETELRILKEQKEEKKSAPVAADNPPKEEDFASYAEYVEALTDYKVEQKLEKKLESKRAEEIQKQAELLRAEEEIERSKKFRSTVDAGEERYPDFMDTTVNNPELVVTPLMMDAALESDHSTDIFYFLGNNPSEARRIANLSSPVTVAREILKLETKFKGKKTTNAPSPIEPVVGAAVHKKSADEESMDEYVARRNKEEQLRRASG